MCVKMNIAAWLIIVFMAYIKHGNFERLEWPQFDADEQDCPPIDAKIITNRIIPWGIAYRAWITIPSEIEIRPSTIKGSGLGAFATTFLPRNTWLGEYEGEWFSPEDEDYLTEYCWQIFRNSEINCYVDAANLQTSNWLRWVNCPRNLKEENVSALYCMGKVYYITSKPIYPGQELFIYYGDEYAKILGIDTTEFERMYV